jgi:hypothetical protein
MHTQKQGWLGMELKMKRAVQSVAILICDLWLLTRRPHFLDSQSQSRLPQT